jgi:hypothetical protein
MEQTHTTGGHMKTTDLTKVYRALLSLDPEHIKEARQILAIEMQERNKPEQIDDEKNDYL